MVLREVPVIEGEDKVAFPRTESLYRVAVTPREVSYGTRSKIVGRRITARIQYRNTAAAGDHVGPLCRVGVPVQLAQTARLEAHGHAGDALGDEELYRRCPARHSSRVHSRHLLLQSEAER